MPKVQEFITIYQGGHVLQGEDPIAAENRNP